MIKVLVTGMSGTGKSTVLGELGRRGHRIVDTDYSGWCEVVTDGPELVQRWRTDRMDALLAESCDGFLFVSGCVPNQGDFYDRFDAVVLLRVSVDVLLNRVASRVTNDFGKSPAERDRIVQDLIDVEPLLRRAATVEVDTDRSLDEVVDAVESDGRRVPLR